MNTNKREEGVFAFFLKENLTYFLYPWCSEKSTPSAECDITAEKAYEFLAHNVLQMKEDKRLSTVLFVSQCTENEFSLQKK